MAGKLIVHSRTQIVFKAKRLIGSQLERRFDIIRQIDWLVEMVDKNVNRYR